MREGCMEIGMETNKRLETQLGISISEVFCTVAITVMGGDF